MSELKQRLIETLKRNLFLKETLRQEIVRQLPTLSDAQINRLQALLDEANTNQDETLRKILEKEPYFFHRIEQTILHTMSEEFNRLTQAEISEAEQALIEDLANYKA